MKESNDQIILTINNCTSTSNASKIISNFHSRSAIVKKFPSILAIKLKIDDKLEPKFAEKPRLHDFDLSSAFVLLFESNNGNQMMLHWKNKNCQEYSTFTMTEAEISTDLKNYVIEFFIQSLSKGGKGEYFFSSLQIWFLNFEIEVFESLNRFG